MKNEREVYLELINGDRQFFNVKDVPTDGNCALHAMGISRDEAITLLNHYVDNVEWKDEYAVNRESNLDIYEILLKSAESQNNQLYQRNQEQFVNNIEIIRNHIDFYSRDGEWMQFGQTQWGILDAIAKCMGKNIKIYLSDENGKLLTVSSNINDESFDSLHIVNTVGKEFKLEGGFNHFMRLVPTRIEPAIVAEVDSNIDVDLNDDYELLRLRFANVLHELATKQKNC